MGSLESFRTAAAALFFAAMGVLSAYHLVVGIWAGLLRRRIVRRPDGYDTGWDAVKQGLLRVFIGAFGLALVVGAFLWWWYRVRPME